MKENMYQQNLSVRIYAFTHLRTHIHSNEIVITFRYVKTTDIALP